LSPGRRLPDAVDLFAQGRGLRPVLRVVLQEAWKRRLHRVDFLACAAFWARL
jgi:hypothetical protein